LRFEFQPFLRFNGVGFGAVGAPTAFISFNPS